MSRLVLLLLALLGSSPDQIEIPPDGEGTSLLFDVPATEILVLEHDLEKAWLEVTHLGSDEPPVFLDLRGRLRAETPFTFKPDLPAGATMVCNGARFHGVHCEEVYRGAGEHIGLPSVEVEFLRGLRVLGSLIQDLDPVRGARLAVVPVEMEAFRPFTMPLGIRGGRAIREVLSDAEGFFELPELAPGEYFLETVLPTGRVHRSDPFSIPDREAFRRNFRQRLVEEDDYFLPLGPIVVPSGLEIEFRVLDIAGNPIVGAAVAATQGSTPPDVLSFEGTSDREGRVVLRGLDIEMAVRVACLKEGYQPFAQEYELLPVAVDCILEPWAQVFGEVIGPDSRAPRGATVTIRTRDEDGETRPLALSTAVSFNGAFAIGQLEEGTYDLIAAAPGFRTEERVVTLTFGQELDVGAILLLFAREIDGLVVDAKTGEPIAGVDIVALSPPGAVNAFSDVDGEFSFAADLNRPLVLRFSTFDYAAREVRLTPAELRSDDPLKIELVPAGWILAIVEDDDGRTCRGCRVVIWPGGEEMWTDGLGEALSGPLEAGTYRVSRPRITHHGSTVVEQPEAELYRAKVRPGRLTVVRLRSAGKSVRVRFEGELEGNWMMIARSRLRTEKSYPEDDGDFFLRQRDGETLEIFLHKYDEDLQAEISVWQATLPPNLLSDDFSIRLSHSTVRGEAAGLSGPLAGSEVRLINFADASLRAVAYTHADGTFRIPQVQPGVYNLYLGPRSVRFVSVGYRQTVDLGRFELFLDRP